MALAHHARTRSGGRWLRLAAAGAVALLALAAQAAQPKTAYDGDLSLAQGAAVIGHNRLAQNAQDAVGGKLLQLALALEEENERALLTLGLLERAIPLQPVESKLTEDKWLDAALARGLELLERDLPRNPRVGPLCLAYLRAVELVRPTDEQVVVGLMKLRRRGQVLPFAAVVARPLALAALFAGEPAKAATPPPKRTKLYETELALAAQAGVLGNNRLAANDNDENGKWLLRVTLAVDPDNEAALLSTGLRERHVRLQPRETKVDEEKFLDAVLARGLELQDKELPKNKKVGPLCLLYLRTVEVFRPADPKAIVALMKLRGKGLTAELRELVVTPLALDDIFGAGGGAPAAGKP